MSANDMNKPSETDWARLDAMSDDEIDTSDIPPLTDDFFARAKLRLPNGTMEVSVHLDPDLQTWYWQHGDDADRILNEALRTYLATQKVETR
jgi:uncharacterized protein (DUF4415 family)